MKRAVFPGSFDPITLGHQDIVTKGLKVFDEIIIGIGENTDKKYMFSSEKRFEFVSSTFKTLKKVDVKIYNGLTVDFCKENDTQFIIRGLRNPADFEFEKALMQEHFNENYMESEQFPKASFRGVVAGLVPDKEGEQMVTVTGTLDMHGVAKERAIEGTMTRDGEWWIVASQFEVACEDHDIDIPKVVSENIAEIIGVTLRAELKLK
mgnify:CR=1 FL=1